MEMKERYVYAVASKLPEKQREEIKKEIHALIDDMMDAMDGFNETNKLEKVLLELGDPSVLADKYRDHTRYLIGPKYFNNYIYTLKIVLIAVFIGISVASLFGLFSDNLFTIITNYMGSLVSALIQGFIWVTVIFAILEYKQVDLNEGKEKWNLKKLQPVPHKKAMISRGETIVGIVFSTLFLILFYTERIAAYIPDSNGEYNIIQIFDYDRLSYFKPLIIVIFLIGIGKEVIKLLYGKWNLKLAISYSILSIISTFLLIALFRSPSIWNENFYTEIGKYINVENQIDIFSNFGSIFHVFVTFVIIGTIIDVATALYKGFKYNSDITSK